MAQYFDPAPGELAENEIPYYGSTTDTEATARAFAADWGIAGVRQIATVEHPDPDDPTQDYSGGRWSAIDTRPNGPIPRR